jgi:hypothetical protein
VSTLGLESVLVGDVGHGVLLAIVSGVCVATLSDLSLGVFGIAGLDGFHEATFVGRDAVCGVISENLLIRVIRFKNI